MPRRRRDAKAVAFDSERNLAMRVLLYSPKDTVAGFLALAVIVAIVVNALFLQAGHHPAPMFGSAVALPGTPALAPSNPLPRPRPTEADAFTTDTRSIEPRTVEPRTVEPRTVEPRAVEPKAAEPKISEPRISEPKASESKAPEPKAVESGGSERRATEARSDPLTNLVKATTGGTQAPGVLRPPAPIPAPRNELSGARRVAAAQRALTEYGYGQLKPSGIVGADTQAAIQKFEREHKMPVTGQVSDRLLRELSVAIGRPLE